MMGWKGTGNLSATTAFWITKMLIFLQILNLCHTRLQDMGPPSLLVIQRN